MKDTSWTAGLRYSFLFGFHGGGRVGLVAEQQVAGLTDYHLLETLHGIVACRLDSRQSTRCYGVMPAGGTPSDIHVDSS